MGVNGLDEHWAREHVKDHLRRLGFVLPLDDAEPWSHGAVDPHVGCLDVGMCPCGQESRPELATNIHESEGYRQLKRAPRFRRIRGREGRAILS